MADVCPTVTAFDTHEYRVQMERIEPFAKRVHIDLMDGQFAPTRSPDLSQIWWPTALAADLHMMYQRPADHLERLISLKPNLVIIHAEADCDHQDFAAQLQSHGIKAGLALLQDTAIEDTMPVLHSFDHVLIFSGDLGRHGGEADMKILYKVRKVRETHSDAEIGWDGGINGRNFKQLVKAGVEVLNVGGFIQDSDDPRAAYELLTEGI
jgi:ribulose-phosphate 3-epimerase